MQHALAARRSPRSSLSGQAVVTLVYKRSLDDAWLAEAEGLRARLLGALGPGACNALSVIGRSRKQKLVAGVDYVVEKMDVAGRQYEYMQVCVRVGGGAERESLSSRCMRCMCCARRGRACAVAAGLYAACTCALTPPLRRPLRYPRLRRCRVRQVEGAFSQPNGGMCQQMLNWAVGATRGAGGDLLELYCGNGNFTLPLAQNFGQVGAVRAASARCCCLQQAAAVG